MTDGARRGHRRLRPELRQHLRPARRAAVGDPEPAGQRRERDRRRHGDEHAAAQPRRGRRRGPAPHRAPGRDLDDLMRFVPGPDLPTGGKIVGLEGVREAYAAGPRQLPHPRDRADRERHGPAQGDRRHRAALHGRPGEGHREDQGAGAGEEAAGHQRPHGPHRPQQRPAPGHRDQERVQPRRRARAALPADADGGVVRHQQRLPRRGPAAHARSQGPAAGLRRPPHRRRPAPVAVPPDQGRRPAAPRRGPARSRSSTSTRSSRSSAAATTPPQARERLMARLRPQPRCRPTTSWRCRCAG